MGTHAAVDTNAYLGREPERLSIAERQAAAGKWIALEIYTPQDLPLRRIEAIGENVSDCIRQLSSRGLDPRRFEYEVLAPAY